MLQSLFFPLYSGKEKNNTMYYMNNMNTEPNASPHLSVIIRQHTSREDFFEHPPHAYDDVGPHAAA